jgi:hypothetical protein
MRPEKRGEGRKERKEKINRKTFLPLFLTEKY